jgi:aminopeptidase N
MVWRWKRRTRGCVALLATLCVFGAGCAGGIGDRYFPTYGNLGYDVHHYDLALEYQPASDILHGVATIRAKATAPLPLFHLDFVGLTVHGVVVDGQPAPFEHVGHELVVRPRVPVGRSRIFTVIVDYSGVPTVTPNGGFFHTPDGALALGQPESAAMWFPANDHPLDEATFTFRVTTPNGFEVVANGLPRAPVAARPGWTTWTWDARSPMATYLATIAIGQWDVRDRHANGMRIIDAVDPDIARIDPALGASIDASLALQPEMIEFFEGQFGRAYPFETAGAIVDDIALPFALETQTRPVYTPLFWPAEGNFVVAHELAHQWFGDDVTLGRWQDIWLNEGFATYAEWLWIDREGFVPLADIFLGSYQSRPADDPFWDLPIGDPGPDAMFDIEIYVRGAMTLYALRLTVGDAAFSDLLESWARTKAGRNVTTPEFVELAERVTGRRLDTFFDDWLFSRDRPPFPTMQSPSTDQATVDPRVQELTESLQRRLALGMR